MQLAHLHSYAAVGIDALDVHIEVHLAGGLPALTIVGLPEAEVRESRDRVRSAIINSGFEFPARRITVNLAPADLPKHGGRFDLPIALGILAASGQLTAPLPKNAVFIGELALSGHIRPVTALLPAAIKCRQQKRILFCPIANEKEISEFFHRDIYLGAHLLDITGHLVEESQCRSPIEPAENFPVPNLPNMSDVVGQDGAKRALEIAAAGAHNLLLAGPPGSGKSMLAARMPGIMPTLNKSERLETASVYAATGSARSGALPPMRAPHHSASAAALVGGGQRPKPGEISLAHGGLLFLDEFTEFSPKVLQALREPLENGFITLSRANYKCHLPARFQLIAAMNPCPCGYLGSERCHCTPAIVQRYLRRISGPLLDRIDLHIEVRQPARKELLKLKSGEPSEIIRQRVIKAREKAVQRQGCNNARLEVNQLEEKMLLTESARTQMEIASERLNLSGRSMHKMLRVARTIADLDESDNLCSEHLIEALSLRQINTMPY